MASTGLLAQDPSTDLAIGAAGPGAVTAGSSVTYTITVTGPTSATGVTIWDVLPAGTTYVSGTVGATACAAPNQPATVGLPGATVTCSVGALSSGSARATIVVNTTVTGTIKNVVGVVGDQFDANMANNSATVTTLVSASVSVAWVRPSGVTWGPANTLTVAGYAANGSGTVQMVWRDVTTSGGWNVVAFQATPAADTTWSNTITTSNYCHTYQVYANYAGVTSSTFTYTGVTSGYCTEAAKVIWIQPQTTAGFGPPGSLIVAGSASNAPSGTGVTLFWRDVTAGGGWNQVGYAPPPDATSHIWYNSFPANFSHVYSVYVTYDVKTSAACGYAGNGAINSCP